MSEHPYGDSTVSANDKSIPIRVNGRKQVKQTNLPAGSNVFEAVANNIHHGKKMPVQQFFSMS